ncbi:MAG: hypothetical protein LBI35_09450 [Burkholderiales bacterium]|jgi:hypothetical protein|nr:hypothetical protein [Burkholderiales bacterium]
MNRALISLATIAACAVLAGCAARASTKLSSEMAEAHTWPVCILRAPLPENIEKTILGFIKASNRSYGSMNEVLFMMAEDARKIGADAVINVRARHQVGALAWARPVAEGQAVKITEKEDFDCLKLGGELR